MFHPLEIAIMSPMELLKYKKSGGKVVNALLQTMGLVILYIQLPPDLSEQFSYM